MSQRTIPSIASVPADYLLAHSVFQSRRFDGQGEPYMPRGRAKLSLTLNRALVERGMRAPWMWSAERCQQFWATRERGDDSNAPDGYAVKATEIVDFMHDLWRHDVARAGSVLEIGCNAGANLNRLRQLGYKSLTGVEINPLAIEELNRVFPLLARTATIEQGRLEGVLPQFATGSFEMVFAMGVLHHIHPSSRQVFGEMTRIARRFICVIEPEQIVSHYIFSRDYSQVFGSLNCRQLRVVQIGRSQFPTLSEDYYGCTARLFSVPES
jgi:SAM-dependent methyltransferase